MYVNDEPLVFSKTFVSVISALSLTRSLMVGWFYGRVLQRSTRGVPPLPLQASPTRTCGYEIKHTHTHTHTHILTAYWARERFDILYYIICTSVRPPPIRYCGIWDKSQSIFRFFFSSSRYYYSRALHLQDGPREQRRGTNDLWKSYKTPYEP